MTPKNERQENPGRGEQKGKPGEQTGQQNRGANPPQRPGASSGQERSGERQREGQNLPRYDDRPGGQKSARTGTPSYSDTDPDDPRKSDLQGGAAGRKVEGEEEEDE